jgi:hypothetical protein
MADDQLVDNGAEADFTVATDDCAGKHVQLFKLAYSADGTRTHVPADADGLLVNLGANNDVTVSGTVTATDGGGSLTVDAASLPLPTGASTEATLADVLTDTGGILAELQGAIDVVATGTVTADTELTTADFDTGAGTDTRAVVGLVLPGSGGGVLVGGSNRLPVDGSGVTQPVSDGGGSITVDGTVGISGSVTVADGGGSLTVDGSVTADTELPTAAALADNAANPTTPMVGAALMVFDGTTWDRARSSLADGAGGVGLLQNLGMLWNGSTHDRMPGNATDGVLVNLGANNDVVVSDGGGSITVDGTVAATQSGTWNIGSITTLPSLPAGTANIGDVDVLSLPSLPAGNNNIGDVDVASLPALAAGTNTIGLVRSKDATGVVDDAGTDRTVKYAAIDAASSGDNTLLAAVASRKIRVLSCFLVAAGSVNVRFEDGAGGTALTGQMNLVANTGFVLPYNPHGWFETSVNTLLNLELSAAVSVDGCLTYAEVA